MIVGVFMKKLNNQGQALVEYVLIITIISVITIALVKYFGGYLKDSITKTSCTLVDQEYVRVLAKIKKMINMMKRI